MEKLRKVLNERLEKVEYGYSDDAFDVVYNMIHDYDNLSYDNVYDASDSVFTYWSDAFEYLNNQSIPDFKEAIAEGHSRIESIAWYYLMEEVHELLADIKFEEVAEDDE